MKELTESILYDFLPAALNVMLPIPPCEDPLLELDADRCRVRAGCIMCSVTCVRHVALWT